MADLIDRDAAIIEVEDWAEHGHDLIHWTGIKAMLEARPSVDAEPVKRGVWYMLHPDNVWICSECEEAWTVKDGWRWRFNYCPLCGAKNVEVG